MKQKILMTASTYGHIRNFHLPYLREFQRLGWETHVGCRGIPADAPYIDKAIELPFEKRMQSLENLRAARLLRGRIASGHYGLIIAHTALAAFFTRLAVKGLRDRPRLIDVVHGYLFDDDTPAIKKRLLLGAERLTAPETDLLITMNRWDHATANQCKLGKQVEQIPGIGVDFSQLDGSTTSDGARLRKERGVPRDAFVVLYAAEFSKRKSQDVLIRTMQYLPESVVLVLCGAGVTLEGCKALAGKLDVSDRVLFPGQITNMGAWYRMADAAVTASRSEGLPFNVMEAMHMGLPVVASAVKGHTDLIKDGETGLLYPYGDAKSCASQIKRVMENVTLRERLRESAKASVERYALEPVLPQVMEQYLTFAGRTYNEQYALQ